jgi:hypothetical protein
MVRRCTDPDDREWHNYGGRGITICEEWLGDGGLARFILDMGERPGNGMRQFSIDRISNDHGYSPTNCVWATPFEQSRNTRQNLNVEHNGERLCITDWAARSGLKAGTLRKRIVVLGWSVERAITQPAGK